MAQQRDVELTLQGLAQQLFINEVNRLGALGSNHLEKQLAEQACTAALLFFRVYNRHNFEADKAKDR